MMQRYLIRHFKPWKAKPANALRSYVTTLLMQPQRWRLHALFEEGELDGEVCETVVIGESGAVVGRPRAKKDENEADMEAFLSEIGESGSRVDHGSADIDELASGEQPIELEFDLSLGEREAARLYGDVQPHHCRLLRMGSDFYVWALESQIGTLVDGRKCRHMDGPVSIRDGTIVAVGRYLLYCEVGEASTLQDRRKRMIAGESFWKIINASLPNFRASDSKPEASEGKVEAAGKEDAEAAQDDQKDGEDDDVEDD